jgi:hypothetical protein
MDAYRVMTLPSQTSDYRRLRHLEDGEETVEESDETVQSLTLRSLSIQMFCYLR